jgi:hypothetical protein
MMNTHLLSEGSVAHLRHGSGEQEEEAGCTFQYLYGNTSMITEPSEAVEKEEGRETDRAS